MRVLLVNSTFGRVIGGSGQHVYLLWKYLRDKVDFIVWNKDNVGYIDLPKLRTLSFYLKAKLKRIPRDVDIIHVHNPKLAGLFRKNKKNILTIHGDHHTELKIVYGPMALPLLYCINRDARKANVITNVSPYWAKKYGWKWIPNMIELNKINRIPPMSNRYLLFVGRDDPVKDYPLFKEIAKRIYKELGIRSLALGIVRENTEYLKHARVPWELVISFMKSAYALVITSKQEGFPTIILEAWASNCPIVARDIPPLRAISELHPNTLLLFRNKQDAILKIKSVILDEDLKKTLINEGAKTVTNYDASKVTRMYYVLYKSLLS